MTALVVLSAIYISLLLAKTAAAAWVVRRTDRIHEATGAGVSIGQAILGGDPRLSEVLEWNLHELPEAQFLWLLDDDDAVGQAVCRELAARHPQLRIEILSSPEPPAGQNPKVYKLARARPAMEVVPWKNSC